MEGEGESGIYLPLYINTLETVEALAISANIAIRANAISTNSHASKYNHFSILFKKGDLLVVACQKKKKKKKEQPPSPILGSAWCDTVC